MTGTGGAGSGNMIVARYKYNVISYVISIVVFISLFFASNIFIAAIPILILAFLSLYELSILCPDCKWKISKRYFLGIPGAFIWFGFPKKCPRCGTRIDDIDLLSPFQRGKKCK